MSNPLDDMPRLHPRTNLVQRAKVAVQTAVLEMPLYRELTTCEQLIVLNEMIATTLKYALRSERHPGEDKGADEA